MSRLDRLPSRTLAGGVIAYEASTFRARFLGLAFMRTAPSRPLLFRGCRSVHTFGMRFPLDITFFDAGGRVLRHEPRVPPGRVLLEWRAAAVLERASQPRQRDARAEASAPSTRVPP